MVLRPGGIKLHPRALPHLIHAQNLPVEPVGCQETAHFQGNMVDSAYQHEISLLYYKKPGSVPAISAGLWHGEEQRESDRERHWHQRD